MVQRSVSPLTYHDHVELGLEANKAMATQQNTITSTLDLFGDPSGYTAMSKAVGLTCGIATQILLDGFRPFRQPGVIAPYTREICDAMRVKIEAEGIRLVEKMF